MTLKDRSDTSQTAERDTFPLLLGLIRLLLRTLAQTDGQSLRFADRARLRRLLARLTQGISDYANLSLP